MKDFVDRLDKMAGIKPSGSLVNWVERIAFVSFVLMILAAPHSIAATQTFWLFGMTVWVLRFAFRPRPRFKASFLALPLLSLFAWSVISSVFSYAPDISIDKLKNASVFLLFFFALNNLRTQKAVRFAAGALIFSCMVNVLWMPLERLIGKGVKIQGVSTESPLYRAGFREGDNLFRANDRKLNSPADITKEIDDSGEASITYYRDGHYWSWKVSREDLLSGNTNSERLGISGWTKSRSWRSSGFYGHYVTYAEVIQLIGSLTFGLFVACLGFLIVRKRPLKDGGGETDDKVDEIRSPTTTGFAIGKTILGLNAATVILAFCATMMAVALLMSITRAPQAGFVVSVFAIVLVSGGRKILFALLILLIPVVVGGVILIQQTRGVGYIDANDSSTTWRLAVYREGFELWTKSPRNFVLGVGMDSIKRYKEEWHLFDDGRMQIGHFHSTPIQLLVERGLPALLLWLWIFAAYLWNLFRALRKTPFDDWRDKGILLGGFGGVCGFLFSSLVHYNYGDEEVIMVLYLIMAMAVTILTFRVQTTPGALPDPQ